MIEDWLDEYDRATTGPGWEQQADNEQRRKETEMRVDQIYSGATLKAADLNGKAVKVQIESYTVQEFAESDGYKKQKIVLKLAGKDKTFVVNKTNANRIAEMHGPDTDDWIGKAIIIHPERVDFQGTLTDALRVRLEQAAPPPPADMDDDIPF